MGNAARSDGRVGEVLPELLLPEHVATWLGVTKCALYNMVSRGEFPPTCIVRIGTRLRFDAASLRSWLAEKRGSPQKSA